MKTNLVLFRNDLRIHDNQALFEASKADRLIPVYVFDPDKFTITEYGFPRVGPHRIRFLLETVSNLRKNLRLRNSNLVIRTGKPHVVIPELVKAYGVSDVFLHSEATSEERLDEDALENALKLDEAAIENTLKLDEDSHDKAQKSDEEAILDEAFEPGHTDDEILPNSPKLRNVSPSVESLRHGVQGGVRLQKFHGSTLCHRDDLPMELHHVPDVFSSFRKLVEKKSKVRPLVEMPDQFPPCPVDDPGDIPKADNLRAKPDHFVWDEENYDAAHKDASCHNGTSHNDTSHNDTSYNEDASYHNEESYQKGVLQFRGGEDAALQRVRHYIWDADRLKIYKETRNGLLGADYSSKFSPWLATGALSPRYIHDQVRQYEKKRVKNSSTYWMIFELVWRDYFKFVFMKHGDALFKRNGIRKTTHPVEWQCDNHLVQAWQKGKTGIPFIDANMLELLHTGFMSNRGRQNAASFFSWNLRQDWRIGAAWFEALLLDYDPCSNWGNWAYNSGVGNDPRQRHFNILGQADHYDKNGDYVRHWIPKLAIVPVSHVHQPHLLSDKEKNRHGIVTGRDYPEPVIDLEASYRKLNS